MSKFGKFCFETKLKLALEVRASESAGVQHQDAVRDPLQDQHQDPWHGESRTPGDDREKMLLLRFQERKPETFWISTPTPSKEDAEEESVGSPTRVESPGITTPGNEEHGERFERRPHEGRQEQVVGVHEVMPRAADNVVRAA